mmetsp:Transcript_54429/g.151618  ORF Transcript_54429/g.151618 Transcript_54429/m.151618 type:complete len:561 (+) Transcript_54429:65-1747(+)
MAGGIEINCGSPAAHQGHAMSTKAGGACHKGGSSAAHNGNDMAWKVAHARESLVLEAIQGGLLDPHWVHQDCGQNLMFFAAARSRKLGGAEVIARRLNLLGVPAHDLDDNQQTPLYYAAREGNLQCMDFLVERRCNVNQRDANGQSPLFYAARSGHVDACRLLLGLGALLRLEDTKGRIATAYASPETHKALLLIDAGLASGYRPHCTPEPGGKKTILLGHPSSSGRKTLTAAITTTVAQTTSVATTLDASQVSAEAPKKRRRIVRSSPEVSIVAEKGNANAQPTTNLTCSAPLNAVDWAKLAARFAVFVRDGDASDGASSPPIVCSREHEARLVQAEIKGRGLYYVARPQPEDATRLRAIEREFVQDHWALFQHDAVASRCDVPEWCEAVNVILEEDSAVRAIVGIIENQVNRHTTLQCVYMPPERGDGSPREPPEVVGYVHFVDMAGHLDASHVKVAADHQRCGLGALLLAGMAKHVEASGKGHGLRDMRLVVMSRNTSAIRLYRALGFQAIGTLEKQLGKTGQKIGWTRMRRLTREPADKALADFMHTCEAHLASRS